MAQKRLIQDRRQTQGEVNRRHADKVSSIDEDMTASFNSIDWNRRKNAEKSLYDWVCTYMVGLILNEEPPAKGKEVLDEMEHAMVSHGNTMLCLARSSGKTSYCQCGCLYSICTGIQKYVVIVSTNQRSSNNLLSDFYKVLMETDTAFSIDYPEICRPFQLTKGALRRRQLYHGVSTDLIRNSETLQFARLVDKDGKDMPTSGSVIETRGYTGQLRGMKRISGGQSIRPTLALLDDWETEDTASSQESVSKMLDIINKDIVPMGGKQRMSLLCTATPLCPDDLVEKLKGDKHWRTVLFPAVISYPKNEELWKQYFTKYDSELVSRTSHEDSLNFYKEHFDEMNEGSDVFNPTRFSREDGHLSAIQKLLELKHQIGESAWASEYMMNPIQIQFSIPINPAIVASRKSGFKEWELPDKGVQFIVASWDLNLSKYITETIVAFTREQTSYIIHHRFHRCAIRTNIPEEEYYRLTYETLTKYAKQLKRECDFHQVELNALAIDGNGVPFKCVTEWCRKSMANCGIPACCFIGKASHQFRSFVRSRLKEEVNRTVLCGDKDEQNKSGSGVKWVYHDSDMAHERVQRAFLATPGNIGSLMLYDGCDHAEWAVQVCNEKLVSKRQRPDGEWEYSWRDNGDHDALDSIGQAYSAYASMGFSTGETGRQALNVPRLKLKKRVRIV